MAENTRRVSVDEQGNITGGLKPMPEGTARVKTPEDLAAEAANRADIKAAEDRRYERQYQSALESYKAGRNAGFGFKPKPEDVKEAMDLRGAASGRRDKFLGDSERFDEANEPKGMKKGGKVKAKYMSFSKTGKPAGMKSVTKMASGGSASKRGDGIAQRGKTKGRMC